MRQFGLTYDDAVAIQSSLLEGLKVQNRFYQVFSHALNSSERKAVVFETKRAMKKIAYLNSFTKAKSKAELREIGKLVVE
ncbi:hypothetical protein MHB43_10260 [Paenibacillus sp. FSL H8-0317]|uniref:hypothetical protein n=1 Tax=Paenibacillus sp. FSL H8-0317 TaxID=2921385 RepID=UPI00325671CD